MTGIFDVVDYNGKSRDAWVYRAILTTSF